MFAMVAKTSVSRLRQLSFCSLQQITDLSLIYSVKHDYKYGRRVWMHHSKYGTVSVDGLAMKDGPSDQQRASIAVGCNQMIDESGGIS